MRATLATQAAAVGVPPDRTFLVAGKLANLDRFDMPRFRMAIAGSVPESRRRQLVLRLPGFRGDWVALKRAAAKKLVLYHAIAAAANGLNPVPGLNVAVDIGIMVNLGRLLVKVFGLQNVEGEAAEAGTLPPFLQDIILPAIAAVRSTILTLVGSSAVGAMVAKESATIATRTVLPLIPIIGSLISSTIAFATTYAVGMLLLDRAAQAAERMEFIAVQRMAAVVYQDMPV